MGVENFGILEAVEMAVGIEEEGEKFYALAAGKTDDPEMKKLFETLREKEIEHRTTFRKLYTEMAEKQGQVDAELYLLDPGIAEVFHAYTESAVFPGKDTAAKLIEKCAGIEDILRMGMQAEKDSILFYHELLRHSPYPEAKDLVEKIIVEEGGHLAFLHRTLKEVSAQPGA